MTTLQNPPADLEQIAARVDVALAKVNALPAPVQVVAMELKEALDALHKQGLTQLIKGLRADPRGHELLFALVEEPAVLTLFQIHGLVKAPDLATRTRLAFDTMREQGLKGEIVSVTDGTAVVRLPEAVGCTGAELKERVRKSLLQVVAGLVDVVVEEAVKQPTLIAVSSLRVRSDWIDGPSRLGVLPGQLRRVEIGATSAVVLQHDQTLAAWINSCPRQGEPLDGGRLDIEDGTITCSAHGLEFDALTGIAVSVPGLALIAVPVRDLHGTVQLKPPVNAGAR